jgi:hypothetical protein
MDMYICSKCSNSTENSVRFCDQCGAPMIEVCQTVEYTDEPVQPIVIEPQVIPQEPAKKIPSEPAVIPQEPKKEIPKVSANPPRSTASSIGKQIAGTVLAAVGLGLGCFGLMLTGTMAGISGSEALAICFGFIGTPLSTVGLVLSSKAAKINPRGKKTGKVLGFIGLGLNVLMVLAGIASLASM